jgi:hypothetical protein
LPWRSWCFSPTSVRRLHWGPSPASLTARLLRLPLPKRSPASTTGSYRHPRPTDRSRATRRLHRRANPEISRARSPRDRTAGQIQRVGAEAVGTRLLQVKAARSEATTTRRLGRAAVPSVACLDFRYAASNVRGPANRAIRGCRCAPWETFRPANLGLATNFGIRAADQARTARWLHRRANPAIPRP